MVRLAGVRRARSACLIVGSLALGCTPQVPASSAAAVAADRQAPEPDAETDSETVHASKPDRSVDALELGWAHDPNQVSDDALRLNKAALKLHAEGDYERALSDFEQAAAASPSYAWPRYNRACALSRLGKTKAATVELSRLLQQDLPTYRQRFLDDPDLDNVRASSSGKELLRRVPQIEAAYGVALQRGVPAFTYRTRRGWMSGEMNQTPLIPYRDLRIGVYDLQTRRFVPMLPKIARSYSGLLDRQRKRAIVATGVLAMESMWEVQPERARAAVYSLERFGTVLMESKRLDPVGGVFYGFNLRIAPANAVYAEQIGVSYANQRTFVLADRRGLTELGFEHGDLPDTHPPPEHDPASAYLSVVEMAEAVYQPAPTVGVRGGKVSIGGATSIALSRGHHGSAQVYPSPDSSTLVVVSDQTRFSDDGASSDDEIAPEARDRHVVDRVDVDAGTVKQLSRGQGIVHVKWAPDGTLMLETSDGVRRYRPGELAFERDVPEWVHVGTPPFPEKGGV